jgi:hypothetical protein
LALIDHMRQAGRQRRQEEPVDPERGNRGHHEQHPVKARRPGAVLAEDQPRDRQHEEDLDQVADDQHPLTPPPVEEDPSERSGQRVREQQHGERRGALLRSGRVLGVEEHVTGERGLEDSVGDRRDEPGRVQRSEA